MAKKLPLLIATLSVFASPCLPTIAAHATSEEDNRTEWSAIELLEQAGAVYERIYQNCLDAVDFNTCISDEARSIMETDNSADSAYLHLRARRFTIASIDQDRQGFKSIYFDSDIFDKLQGNTTSEQINYAYFGWANSPIENLGSYNFFDLHEGRIDGVTYLAYKTPTTGSGLDTGTNQVKVYRNTSNFYEDSHTTLVYSMLGDGDFAIQEQYDLSECLESLSYDLECRAMVNGQGKIRYQSFPRENKVPGYINEVLNYRDGYNMGLDDGYDTGYYDGYDDGYETGRDDGYDEGYGIGRDDGYDEGYEDGHENGYANGYNDGYNEGYTNGNEDGYFNGKNDGYTDGYNTGYQQGYLEGVEVGKTEAEYETKAVVEDEEPTGKQAQTIEASVNDAVISLNTNSGNTALDYSVKYSIKTPNTGTVTSENNSTGTPWWIGAIFALGLATIIWFFWPNHKNSQKNPKNSKK